MNGPYLNLGLAVCLSGLGLFGLLVSRNLIRLIVSQQVMSKGAIVALMIAGTLSGQSGLAQSLAVTFIFVDTATAVIALALAIRVQQKLGTLDLRALSSLKG
jgi:NADH:ubiquinone oxidoreductase subunit K